eukprot:jgi/Tetstr1/437724/TSEL_026378.t1
MPAGVLAHADLSHNEDGSRQHSGDHCHEWYNGRYHNEFDGPDLKDCIDKADARTPVQRWARLLGVKAVGEGGNPNMLIMKCSIGGRVAERKRVLECDVDKTRRTTSKKAVNKAHRCPFQINATRDKTTGKWSVTLRNMEHNHQQYNNQQVIDYAHRIDDFTE